MLAAFLVLGGLFSIGNGNGWFAPLWLIPLAAIGWLVLSRRNGGTPQTGYGSTPPALRRTPRALRQPRPPAPYGTPAPPAPHGATPPPPGEAMSTPTPMYAAPPMASAPTQSPAPPYAGGQPGAYRGPQPGTYGGPPAGAQPGPYGGRPTPPAPPRPIAPPPPPRPRRRRPSAFVGLVSLGIALVGIGLGAALDDPLGFPGSSATLGFLIALTGVSVVVLTLGLSGRASGFSGFLVVVLALLLVAASAASRVEVRTASATAPGPRCPPPASRPTSSVRARRPSTCSQLDSPHRPSTTPQRITVEMGAGELTILVPDGLDTRVDASVGFGDITHRGGIGGSSDTTGSDRSTTTVIGDQPVQVVVDAQLGLGQITIQEQ